MENIALLLANQIADIFLVVIIIIIIIINTSKFLLLLYMLHTVQARPVIAYHYKLCKIIIQWNLAIWDLLQLKAQAQIDSVIHLLHKKNLHHDPATSTFVGFL